MQIDLTVTNYRCFADSDPLRISIRDGFTAFVGANNAGKSSALRFLYEWRSLFEILARPVSPPSLGFLASSLREPSVIPFMPPIKDVKDLFCDMNDRELEMSIRLVSGDEDLVRHDLPNPTRLVARVSRDWRWECRLDLDDGSILDHAVSQAIQQDGSTLFRPGQTVTDLAPLVSALDTISKTFYVGAFRNALELEGNARYYDISVGQNFITQWRSWKSGSSKDHRAAARRVTDDIRRIFGFRSLDIDASDDGHTLVVDVDGRSYMLSEMGSGLTQFILVLAHAAMRSPQFILIDEPELSLHPALQMDFLTSLGSYAQRGTIFATHSIGLARAVGNQVYSFRRGSDGRSSVRSYLKTPQLSEFLGELGFSGYQELGFDTVLLVEGVTEVPTIQQLLRLYGKDHKVVIVPMGGDQFINANATIPLEELKRITSNVSALIDSERGAENARLTKNRREFVEACKKADVACHVLEYRALENYLPDAAIKHTVGERYRALTPFEHMESATSWGKGNNWRIASQMTVQDLADNDLGKFLAGL